MTPQPAAPGRGVLVLGADVPDWIGHWCRRTGRPLVREEGPAALMRPGPSLLVPAPPPVPAPGARGVVVAVRELPDEDALLTEAAGVAVHLAVPLVVLHGVPRSFGERSVGLGSALRRGELVLEQARELVAAEHPLLQVVPRLHRAWPHELVGETLDADLLVLGGARAGSGGRLGLVARSALNHAVCPLLLVPRPAREHPPYEPGGSRSAAPGIRGMPSPAGR